MICYPLTKCITECCNPMTDYCFKIDNCRNKNGTDEKTAPRAEGNKGPTAEKTHPTVRMDKAGDTQKSPTEGVGEQGQKAPTYTTAGPDKFMSLLEGRAHQQSNYDCR